MSVRRGKDPWAPPWLVRDLQTVQGDVADARGMADVDLELVGTCHAILSQLPAAR